MPISVDDLESLRSILSALPRHQPKQVSKQEAITSLVSELAAAQRRGYSADDLARLMSENGIDINAPTLRNCLRRLRKKRRARDKATTPQSSGGTIAGSSTTAFTDKKAANRGSPDGPKGPAPTPPHEPGTAKVESRAASSSSEDRTPQK